jgi:hypothetical protein
MPAKMASYKAIATGERPNDFYYGWHNFPEAIRFAPFGYRCTVPQWIPWDATIQDHQRATNMRVLLYVFQHLELPPHIRQELPLSEFYIRCFEGGNGEDFALLRNFLPDGAQLAIDLDLEPNKWKYTNGKRVFFQDLVPLVAYSPFPLQNGGGNNYHYNQHAQIASASMGAMFGYQVYVPPNLQIKRDSGETIQQIEFKVEAIRNYVRDNVLVPANGEPESIDAFDMMIQYADREGYVTAVRRRGAGGIILEYKNPQSATEAGFFLNPKTRQKLALKNIELPVIAGQEFELVSFLGTETTYGFKFKLPRVFERAGENSISCFKSDFIADEVIRPYANPEENADDFAAIAYPRNPRTQLWIRKHTANGYQLAHVDIKAEAAIFTTHPPRQNKRPFLLVQFDCMPLLKFYCSDQYGYRLWVLHDKRQPQQTLKTYVKERLRKMGIDGDIAVFEADDDDGEERRDFTIVPMINGYYAILRAHDKKDENNQLSSIDAMPSSYATYTDITNGLENRVTFDRLLDLTSQPKNRKRRH